MPCWSSEQTYICILFMIHPTDRDTLPQAYTICKLMNTGPVCRPVSRPVCRPVWSQKFRTFFCFGRNERNCTTILSVAQLCRWSWEKGLLDKIRQPVERTSEVYIVPVLDDQCNKSTLVLWEKAIDPARKTQHGVTDLHVNVYFPRYMYV